jgi:hypothetical protein
VFAQEKPMTTFNFDSDAAGQPPQACILKNIQWDEVNRRFESAQRRST